jgi:hypothetical protein
MTNRLEGRHNPEPGEDFEKPPRVQVQRMLLVTLWTHCSQERSCLCAGPEASIDVRPLLVRAAFLLCVPMIALATRDALTICFSLKSFLAVRHGTDYEAT